MKIFTDEGICTCCGNYEQYSYGDENFSVVEKDLENYNKYKDIFVYKCPNCNFISTNLCIEEGVLACYVKDSLEYKQALNYEYLKGLDNYLYNYHSQKLPANLYEAYSFVCLELKYYDKYIRTLNRAIELKEKIAKAYRISQAELGDDEDNDDKYDQLEELINQSILQNRQQLDYYYSQLERKNSFLELIYIENLVKLNKKQEAKECFENLKKQVSLKSDLIKYIQEQLN